MTVQIGDAIPDVNLKVLGGQGPQDMSSGEIFNGKKVVMFAVPGAFTPTCSAAHLPGFVANADKIKAKGVDTIVCVSVNDPFVMDAWGKSQDIDNKIIMLADPYLNFTKLIGAEVDKTEKGLGIRSNRYSMLIDNLIVLKIYEEKDTKSCDVSSGDYYLDNW